MPEVSEFTRSLAAALRAKLRDSGVTQEQVAEALGGRSQSLVSDRLRGLRPIDTDLLDAAAHLLGTDTGSLVRSLLRDAAGFVGDQ